MRRVIVDDVVRSRLHDFVESLDLCDASGKIIGRLFPFDELPSNPRARVVVDEVLRNKLENLTQPLHLCDSSGLVLGRFVPTIELSEHDPWEPELSEEELRQEELSNEKRYTTAEVLAHLKSL